MSLRIANHDRDDRLSEGLQFQQHGDYRRAVACFEEAVRVSQKDLQALIQLGFALIQLKEWRRAAAAYEQIGPLLPRDHRVWSNLSYLYERAGEMSLAEDRAHKAIRIAPNCEEAWNNLGLALRGQHRFPQAIQAFQQALARQPELALAEFNLATTRLLLGNGELGWPGYESRFRIADARLRMASSPRWYGDALSSGKLHVFADQGLGDTMQFARFLPDAKSRSQTTVVLSCQPELVSLLTGIAGADEVCAWDQEPEGIAAEIAVSSLPGLFGIEPQAPPIMEPYLAPLSAPLKSSLAELLSDISPGRRRIGLAWQGNPRQGQDEVRSIPLYRLLPLAQVPNATWISLQVGDEGRDQLDEVADRWPIVDLGARLESFADTAAVMSQLDLVITVDTAVAHLAGALGRPVWTLLCHTPDWRWGIAGSDCPWYPTMRLFRQPRWGDWDRVAHDVCAALA